VGLKVPTGYGNQTGLFTPLLKAHYDIRISSFYGLEGTSLEWEGIKVLPTLGGTYGNESLPQHAERFFGKPRDGLVVTLMDVWVLDAKMCADFDMACWVPVDHKPVPPRVSAFFRESQAIPLAMSRFGMEQLAEFDPIYVPHGVDTSVYKPYSKALAREKLGMDPDAFMVGMVAANKGNPSRKSFATVLRAFAEFRRKAENAKLYLHTDIEGMWSSGVALPPLIEALGIPSEAIGHPESYVVHFHPMSGKAMAHVYSAMDVLVNPSMGEGFGIPVLEAQACGVPAIVTDFSAMPEVCGAGWTVSGQPWWTSQNSWQMLPDVGDVAEALDECYRMPPAARKQLSEQARSHALQYDVEVVLRDYMLPGLEAAQERLGDRRPMVVKAKAA
jgi:glycosyltransferase involved in cell wall biosynthesis